MKPHLHAVETEQSPALDISAAMRAERSDLERWRRVHIAGDRAKAIAIAEAPKRVWRG